MLPGPTDAALHSPAELWPRAGAHRPAGEPAAYEPVAVGVDLGGATTRIWASGRGTSHVADPTPATASCAGPVVRGRIIDPEAMRTLLTGLRAARRRPLPPGGVVVACRPVGSGQGTELAMREVLTSVFAPDRLLFIDTVRAAAIGSGAAPGPLLIADVGAHLTEVAVLAGGAVVAAQRRDVGLRDEIERPDPEAAVVAAVTDLVARIRRQPGHRQSVAAAVHGGLLLVGGGATRARLAARIAGTTGIAVRSPAAPQLVAVRGAGLAALAALRRSAMRR